MEDGDAALVRAHGYPGAEGHVLRGRTLRADGRPVAEPYSVEDVVSAEFARDDFALSMFVRHELEQLGPHENLDVDVAVRTLGGERAERRLRPAVRHAGRQAG